MVVVIAIIFIFVSSGILTWSYRENPDSDTTLASVQQIRDEAILYLTANHTETAPLANNLTWSGGKLDNSVLGSETYLYISGNWQIQISYPLVHNPLYSISVNYTSEEATVVWRGTYQNGVLEEVSSDITLNYSGVLTQPQIRDLAMNYLTTFHNQTAAYMLNLTWVGGRVTSEGLLGAEVYRYQSSDWVVTIQYPVVPSPIYTITVQYTDSLNQVMIDWHGTLQAGFIIETAYTYTPSSSQSP